MAGEILNQKNGLHKLIIKTQKTIFMETLNLGTGLLLVACIALILMTFTLLAILKKLSRILAILVGADASSGAVGGNPIKVGPGPKGGE